MFDKFVQFTFTLRSILEILGTIGGLLFLCLVCWALHDWQDYDA